MSIETSKWAASSKKFCIASVLVAVGLTFLAPSSKAATLALGDATAVPAQPQVALPLSLTVATGEQVTAFCTDIHFDPALISWTNLALEPTISSLGKQVTTNVIAPGHIRVVVYGTDRQALPAGTVAQALLQILSSATVGTTIVGLQNGLGSTPIGTDQPLTLSDGRLWIDLPQDITAPQISAVAVSSITTQGATVSWQTNEPARSTLSVPGTVVDGEAALSLSHQAVLIALTSETLFNFSIVAADESGNQSAATNGSFTTLALPDTIAPTLTVASPIDGATILLGAAVTVTGVAKDDRAGVKVSVNGSFKSVAADGSFQATLTPASSGVFAITVSATDAANNATVIQRSITVEQPAPSVTAPTVLISNPINGSTLSGSSTSITFSVQNVTLAVGSTHLALNLDNGPTMYLYSLTPYGWSNITAGTHTIRLRIVDANHVPFTNPEATANVSFTAGSTSTTTTQPTVSGISISVISPVSGSTVSSNTTLKFSVQGVKLGTSNYHLHIRLDGGATWHVYSTDPLYLKNLKIGQHKVTLQLVDKNHAIVSGSGAYAETIFQVTQ